MTFTEVAKLFEPATSREVAIAKRCRLRHAELNKDDANACPCTHPSQCQIVKLIDEEHLDDEE